MCRRFFEKDGFRFHQFTATHATAYHVGISVGTSIKTIRSDHTAMLSFSVTLLIFSTAAVSARTRWQRAAFSARDSPYEGMSFFNLAPHPPRFNFAAKQRSTT